MKCVSFPNFVLFFSKFCFFHFNLLEFWSTVVMFSLFSTRALHHKWSLHTSTHFQSIVCWQNLQNSISSDTQKLFGNCSALHFGITLPASRAAFDTLAQCLWSDIWVIPCISDPPRTFSSDECSSFSRKRNFMITEILGPLFRNRGKAQCPPGYVACSVKI